MAAPSHSVGPRPIARHSWPRDGAPDDPLAQSFSADGALLVECFAEGGEFIDAYILVELLDRDRGLTAIDDGPDGHAAVLEIFDKALKAA